MKINKKVAFSFLTIAGTLTAVVGITLAQFTSQATLAGNTLTTGSSSLGIGLAPCDSTTSAISGVSTTGVGPGDSGHKDFCLKNNGTGSLTVTGMANVTGGTLDPSLVTVKVNCGADVAVDLNGTPSGTIATIAAGAVVNCTITQTLSGSASSSAQNKTITYDVVFNGT